MVAGGNRSSAPPISAYVYVALAVFIAAASFEALAASLEPINHESRGRKQDQKSEAPSEAHKEGFVADIVDHKYIRHHFLLPGEMLTPYRHRELKCAGIGIFHSVRIYGQFVSVCFFGECPRGSRGSTVDVDAKQ